MSLGRAVGNLFTNWREYDAPVTVKLLLTGRNRAIASVHGCCGHPGEPGC